MEYENNRGSSRYIIVLLESLMRPDPTVKTDCRKPAMLPIKECLPQKSVFTNSANYKHFQQTIKKKTRQQIPPKSEKNPKNNKDHYALVKVVQCFLVVANLHTMIQGLRHPVNT